VTDSTDVFADGAARRVAETALQSVTAERPRTVEPLGRGNRKRTAIVRFDSRGPVVLQLCTEQTWLRTESVLLAEIRQQTDVPVPPVLAADVTDEVAYMVTAFVPGVDLHEQFTHLSRERQRALSRTFGRYLGTLHDQFRFDRYGTITVESGGLTAQSEDWPGWLAEYGGSAIERLPPEFDPIRAELRALVTGDAPGGSPPAKLFPWDFRPGNAIVADGRVTAILDWEAPLAAPPALSAAKAEYLVADWYTDDSAPLRAAFVDGYERSRAYPDVRPAHRVAAIAASAVDSTGTVTNPRYPELDREAAVAFHRENLRDLL
jgi:aminoglycoside phosphotransferase (APT) family kinase protein